MTQRVSDLTTDELEQLVETTRRTLEDCLETLEALNSDGYLESIREAREDQMTGRVRIPARLAPSIIRYPDPFGTASEGSEVNLGTTRIVGLIGQPATIGRKHRIARWRARASRAIRSDLRDCFPSTLIATLRSRRVSFAR